jgi:hypothetical protein
MQSATAVIHCKLASSNFVNPKGLKAMPALGVESSPCRVRGSNHNLSVTDTGHTELDADLQS